MDTLPPATKPNAKVIACNNDIREIVAGSFEPLLLKQKPDPESHPTCRVAHRYVRKVCLWEKETGRFFITFQRQPFNPDRMLMPNLSRGFPLYFLYLALSFYLFFFFFLYPILMPYFLCVSVVFFLRQPKSTSALLNDQSHSYLRFFNMTVLGSPPKTLTGSAGFRRISSEFRGNLMAGFGSKIGTSQWGYFIGKAFPFSFFLRPDFKSQRNLQGGGIIFDGG